MTPLEGDIRSDHKAVFAELDVRTLVTPTPTYILEHYYAFEYKVKVDEASEEQWESFSVRLDEVLDAKMAKGSARTVSMGTNTSPPTDASILKEDMIDYAWDNLAKTIMDVALETLPRKRIGSKSLAYRTNVQNRQRGRCLGELLRLTYFGFVNPKCPIEGKEGRQMAAHEAICKVWLQVITEQADATITAPPDPEADRTVWEQWRDTVKVVWGEQQR
ncbi:hypothetical protein BGX23_005000, partial [Mortierella sp. AD031]